GFGAFGLGRIAQAPTWGAADEAVSWELGALGHQSVGIHDAAATHARATQHQAAVFDAHFVAQGARVDNRVVADPYVTPDARVGFELDVDCRPLANVEPRANVDPVLVATQHGRVAQDRWTGHTNLAHDERVFGQRNGLAHLGRERQIAQNGHAA